MCVKVQQSFDHSLLSTIHIDLPHSFLITWFQLINNSLLLSFPSNNDDEQRKQSTRSFCSDDNSGIPNLSHLYKFYSRVRIHSYPSLTISNFLSHLSKTLSGCGMHSFCFGLPRIKNQVISLSSTLSYPPLGEKNGARGMGLSVAQLPTPQGIVTV